MMKFSFQLFKKSPGSLARAGVLSTPRGEVETPLFMPVGTQATVKAMTPDELLKIDAKIILANTYHLYLRPGCDVIEAAGGLHKFMKWDRLLLTDSGGYQVFSLQALRKVSDEGVLFKSHIDGSEHFFTPEKVIEVEEILGSDIIMPLDECLPYPCDYDRAKESLALTNRWARRCFDTKRRDDQWLFGIIQGSFYKDLRKSSLEFLAETGFTGFSIGGLSVGEPKHLLHETLENLTPHIPDNSPRYLMGVGKPEDLLECVERGVDLFDCVFPSRVGRNGTILTWAGKLALKNARFRTDFSPPDPECSCEVCQTFTRAYLRHLFIAEEILGARLATYHNLHFMLELCREMRKAILEERFDSFKKQFLEKYFKTNSDTLRPLR